MKKQAWLKYVFLVVCFFILPVFARQAPSGVTLIQQLIDKKDYKAAGSSCRDDIAYFLAQNNIDTLIYYIPLQGSIAYGLEDRKKGVTDIFSFIDLLKTKQATPKQLMSACREAAEFFETYGQNDQAYEVSTMALSYAKLLNTRKGEEMARCQYNLGVYAFRLGNVVLSATHHHEAVYLREADSKTSPEDLYFSYNAMGAIMWSASKYDSANFFYEKALASLKKMPDNDLNKYFRPANVYNNMAALYSAEGKTSEGIAAMRLTIQYYQKFIASKNADSKKASATEGLYEAIDNLAGIYKELGDYRQAGDLLRYAYEQKKKKLDPGKSGIFISEILLGQHYNSIREYEKARKFLTDGLEKLNKAGGDYLFWAGDAWYGLALVNENTGNMQQAARCYDSSEAMYELSYQGSYDNMYMDFMRNEASFFAKNNEYPRAYNNAQKVYRYLQSVGEGESLQGFYQLLHIAELTYMAGKYREAIQYADKALTTVSRKQGNTALDSVKIETFNPKRF